MKQREKFRFTMAFVAGALFVGAGSLAIEANASEAGSSAECDHIPYNSGRIYSCAGSIHPAQSIVLWASDAHNDALIACGINIHTGAQVCGSYSVVSGNQYQSVTPSLPSELGFFPEIHLTTQDTTSRIKGFAIYDGGSY